MCICLQNLTSVCDLIYLTTLAIGYEGLTCSSVYDVCVNQSSCQRGVCSVSGCNCTGTGFTGTYRRSFWLDYHLTTAWLTMILACCFLLYQYMYCLVVPIYNSCTNIIYDIFVTMFNSCTNMLFCNTIIIYNSCTNKCYVVTNNSSCSNMLWHVVAFYNSVPICHVMLYTSINRVPCYVCCTYWSWLYQCTIVVLLFWLT